jgi:hypothetical protein
MTTLLKNYATVEPSEAMKRLAAEAICVQNGVNLCGMSKRFAEVMSELMTIIGSTGRVNHHPIARLWVEKFAHLAGIETSLGYIDAFEMARQIERGEAVEYPYYFN